MLFFFFFFNDTATTEIYTLSLHDALPICRLCGPLARRQNRRPAARGPFGSRPREAHGDQQTSDFLDRKSTRLNSSHSQISYAVFCLKKKKTNEYFLRTIDTVLQSTENNAL